VSAGVDRAALITGVAGQDGVYLAKLLLSQGYRVTGSVLPGAVSQARFAPYLLGVEVVETDLRDGEAMRALLATCRPDEVYNLAGLSTVAGSWSDASRVAAVNGEAVLTLLQTLLRCRDDVGVVPRLFQASSAAIFGSAQHQPQDERTPQQPESPYAAAKCVAHNAVVDYRGSAGLFACNGILFNHESPLRSTAFVTRKVTRAVAEIAAGQRSELLLGNLEARRDWGAAADYVRAMQLMLHAEAPADYVIATGVPSSLRDVVELAFGCVGIDDPWRYVREDPELLRPADAPQTWGDPSRAKAELGWSATTSLAELIHGMVMVDVERIRTGVEESPEYVSLPT
jgi:GDPmannose 4,6-dehydratase